MNPDIKSQRQHFKARLIERALEWTLVFPLRIEGRKLQVYARRLWHTAMFEHLGMDRRDISVLTGWTTGQISYDIQWVRKNPGAVQSVKAIMLEIQKEKREEKDANLTNCATQTPGSREAIGSHVGSG